MKKINLLLLIILFSYACDNKHTEIEEFENKQEEFSKIEIMQIVEARSFFESSVENLESIKVKNGRQFLRHSIDKYIFWDEAYFRYINNYNYSHIL